MEPEELEQLTPQELLELISSFPPEWDEYLDWFMYKFSVLSSPDNWTFLKQHEETLKDEVFVVTALSQLFDKIEPKYFLETLNIFACLDGFEQILVANGVSGLLVRAMAQVLDKKKPSRAGCKIIASLSVDDQVRFFLGKPNRLAIRIKEVLHKYPQHEQTQLDVMHAIINISFRSKQAKYHFLAQDPILEGLFQTIHMHNENIHLVVATLCAIRNLVTLADAMDTTKDAVQFTFTQTMKILADHSNPHVRASALWVILILVSDRPHYKEAFVSHGGVSIIFSLLESCPDDGYCTEPAVILLGLLAKLSKIRKAVFQFAKQKKYTNFGPLCQLLQSNDEVVVAATLRALFRLSFHEETRLYLGNPEMITAACQACKANPVAPVCQAIALFLRQLAKTLAIEKLIIQKKTLIMETGAHATAFPNAKKLWGPLQDIALGKLEQQRVEDALNKENEEANKKALQRKAQEELEHRKLQEAIEQQRKMERENAANLEKERREEDVRRKEEIRKRKQEALEEERRLAKLAEEAELKKKEELRLARLAQEKELEERFERERQVKEAERQQRIAESKKIVAQKAAQEEQKQAEILKRMQDREKQRELEEKKFREEKRLANLKMTEAVKQALLKKKEEQERLEKEFAEEEEQIKQEREQQRQKTLEQDKLKREQEEQLQNREKETRRQRRTEREKAEEQQKRLQAQKQEEALKRQANRIKLLDQKFAEEAKRRENLRNFVREKEAEQERMIISQRMKAREDKRRQLDQQREQLIAHSREFAEKRFREAQTHDEQKLLDLLSKSHEHTQQTLKREAQENTNTAKLRNERRRKELEALEEQQKLFRQEADQKRAERAKFRAFSSIRGLMGDTVQLEAVEQQAINAALNKRASKAPDNERDVRDEVARQEHTLQKHAALINSNLTAMKDNDDTRKVEERDRQLTRDTIQADRFKDEANFSAMAYLDRWKEEREARRRERRLLLDL